MSNKVQDYKYIASHHMFGACFYQLKPQQKMEDKLKLQSSSDHGHSPKRVRCKITPSSVCANLPIGGRHKSKYPEALHEALKSGSKRSWRLRGVEPHIAKHTFTGIGESFLSKITLYFNFEIAYYLYIHYTTL